MADEGLQLTPAQLRTLRWFAEPNGARDRLPAPTGEMIGRLIERGALVADEAEVAVPSLAGWRALTAWMERRLERMGREVVRLERQRDAAGGRG